MYGLPLQPLSCYHSTVHPPLAMARTPGSPPSPPVSAPPAPMAQPVAAPVTVMPAHRKATLLEAIAAAWPAFGDLVKDSTNDYLKSKFLKLPGLLKAIKGPLLEQGCTVYTQVVFSEGMWVVRTTIALVDGREEVSSDFPIPDISNMQKVAGCMTFGTRYNLFALLAICPDDADDDGNSGGYSAPPNNMAAPLPGLPGGVAAPAAWPMPGQQVQAPPAMYHQAPPMPAAIAYPVQPLPVLQ